MSEPAKTKEPEEKRLSSSGRPMKYADNILPIARIKKIMKMDQNINNTNISHEASYLICSATEHFIKWLSKEVYAEDKKAILSYDKLSKFIQDDEHLDFLQQIVPNRIKVKEYKKIIAEEKEAAFNSDSDVTTSSSSEESDNEEEADDEEESEEEVEEIEKK